MVGNNVKKLLHTVHKRATPSLLPGAVRGVLSGITDQGEPLVDFYGNSAGESLLAVATVSVQAEDVGREAILLFEDGDPKRPLMVGLVGIPGRLSKPERTVGVVADGRRVTVSAENEIVLRCGEASITLTRAGKVLIKGTYVLSRSAGVNRIRGGSVQLN